MSRDIYNLPIGARVKFGVFYGTPIVWKVATKHHSGYPIGSVTLFSEQLLKFMCFDAKEPANSDADRKTGGNNRYMYSNIRQWLNSDAGAGAWYNPQHPSDTPPNSTDVANGYNQYSTSAGFLNGFNNNEKNILMPTTTTVVTAPADNGVTDRPTDKMFLLAVSELGFALPSTKDEGTTLDLFYSGAQSLIAAPTTQARNNSEGPNKPNPGSAYFWMTRSVYTTTSNNIVVVSPEGYPYIARNAYSSDCCVRPACNIPTTTQVTDTTDVDDCYTIIYNQPPTTPSSVTVPENVNGGEDLSVSWGASTDSDGNLSGYKLERAVNSGSWTQIYSGTSQSFVDFITFGWNTVQYRVKAYDSAGAESGYATSPIRTVFNNRPPEISGIDRDLGTFSNFFMAIDYVVTDPDNNQVTVVEKLDGVTLRTYTATLGSTNTINLTDAQWVQILNGSHTITITATDEYNATVVRTLTFTKVMNSIEFLLRNPLPVTEMPTKCMVNIQGKFPEGSILTIEICNNGNDDNPTWENITTKVLNSQKHFFTNTTKTASAWGVNLRVNLQRGTATEACYIQSIGGNFG